MGPCQGVTVVDLTRYLPGRSCTLMLADLGAEVITVEPPRVPSTKMKSIGQDTGARYLAINRNKKSMVLDLNKEEGRAVFYELVRKADVIVEGSRPGVAEHLKIDYSTVKEFNPKIVYCSISNFGQDGPYRNRPAMISIASGLRYSGCCKSSLTSQKTPCKRHHRCAHGNDRDFSGPL